MGRARAAVATANAIHAWKGKFVLMVGIAGGIANRDVRLGDALIAEQIVDYEIQKVRPDGVEPRFEAFRCDHEVVSIAANLRPEDWNRVTGTEPKDVPEEPSVHVGPVASGDKIVADATFLSPLRRQWPKVVGVEMEGAGVALAAAVSAARPRFAMVRGVSDFADKGMETSGIRNFRARACAVAARLSVEVLRQLDMHTFGQSPEGTAEMGEERRRLLGQLEELREAHLGFRWPDRARVRRSGTGQPSGSC
jgi:nucleoside phosphorylase